MNAPRSREQESLGAVGSHDPSEEDALETDEPETGASDHGGVNGQESRRQAPEGPSLRQRAQAFPRQAWDEIQMAFPRLMGQPAYWQPRREYKPQERPFDPDDLPLEAERSDEDQRALELARAESAREADRAASQHQEEERGWRAVTSRILRPRDE